MIKRSHTRTPSTNPSLEYAAILSGLSMGGDFISEDNIKEVRHLHTRKFGNNIGFSPVSLSAYSER